MPDTPRTKAELQTLLADNSPLKAITAQKLRDFVVSVMQEMLDTQMIYRGKVDPAQPTVQIDQGIAGGGTAKPALLIQAQNNAGFSPGHYFEIWEYNFGTNALSVAVKESGELWTGNWMTFIQPATIRLWPGGTLFHPGSMLDISCDVDGPAQITKESLGTHLNNHPYLYVDYLGNELSRITKAGEYSTSLYGKGVLMRSPDGSQFRLGVSDAGAPVVTRLSGGVPAWLQTLIVTDLGKVHADIPFVHDYRSNPIVEAGKLVALYDARGLALYGALLGAMNGTVSYTAGPSGYFVNDMTASSMMGDPVYSIGPGDDRIKCVVLVTDAPDIPATTTAGIAEIKDAGNNRHIHLTDGRCGDIDGGNFASYFTDTTGTFRVIFWGTNDAATQLKVTAYGKATVTQANTHAGATQCTLNLGRSQIWGSSAFPKIRFCMGLTWDPSAGEMTTIFNALKAQWSDITAHTP